MHFTDHQSNQSAIAMIGGKLRSIELPCAATRVGFGPLLWGGADEIGSPAYWASQSWMWAEEHPLHYKLGRTLKEELLACLLGGYGIPAEVGLAAYERLNAADHGDPDLLKDPDRAVELLMNPLQVGARTVRYRFANQKGRYVASMLQSVHCIDDHADDTSLRDAITSLPGFGPKTASWVVRNWRGSDKVSILDVHIVRAARMLHLFKPEWRVERHYGVMEAAYLRFAEAIGARASILDSVMWMTMRQLPATLVKSFVAPGFEPKRCNLHHLKAPFELTAT